MSMGKIEQKVIELAHMFVEKYGRDALKTKHNDWVKYIIPHLNRYEKEIFIHNQFKLLVLFYKTVVTDLRNSRKKL